MEIKGKVHCFFEQSGTFKNEFIKLGIPAEDYDIQNNFGETDHVIEGRCKYHTNTQRSETGIVCYYNAHLQGYENGGNYFVMLHEGGKLS